MKRFAIIVALLLGVAVVAPAASADDLTVAMSSLSTETLDPVLGGHIVKFYLDQIFDYLVGVTPDGQLSADDGIATRWESSPDHKRWTFHLRRGVRFHNGDELTADDVKWSLQRAMGKRSTTGYAEPLRVLIKDIETPAPDRVVIVTKDAEDLKKRLVSDEFSPIKYDAEKPKELLEEDKVIGALKLNIPADRVKITPVEEVFAR